MEAAQSIWFSRNFLFNGGLSLANGVYNFLGVQLSFFVPPLQCELRL
jgi:hypothetical protein